MSLIDKTKKRESIESILEKVGNNVIQRLQPSFDNINMDKLPSKLLLLGLKEEQILEVYVLDGGKAQLLKKYRFTAFSGHLGPKLEVGDKQIPEGIYSIEYLNPNSAYYLSMKINYPNEFDVSRSDFNEKDRMGNDIFIHGKATSVGCIAIGDEAIEELFYLVANAINQEVKVIISPRDFRIGKSYPSIDAIDWEEELYKIIDGELKFLFPVQ